MRGTFPLYTEAVKSFGKPEAMIRTAVKTLTLNVYKGFFFEFSFRFFLGDIYPPSIKSVEDAAMRKFILEKTTATYFSNVTWFIANQIEKLNDLLESVS